MAYNDITGKAIKTTPQNKQYSSGWDKIFAKKTSHEWLKELEEETVIYDADGWDNEVTMDTPIKYNDFMDRLCRSTVQLGKPIKM
jgi:hypothetical protein